jgi:hypothetical protein
MKMSLKYLQSESTLWLGDIQYYNSFLGEVENAGPCRIAWNTAGELHSHNVLSVSNNWITLLSILPFKTNL